MTDPANVSAAIGAENTFTDELDVSVGDKVSITFRNTSSFIGTISLLRRLPNETEWDEVQNPDGSFGWTTEVGASYTADERCDLKLGCKTGDYTSGSGFARLGKG